MIISHIKFRAKEKMKKDKAIILGVSLIYLLLMVFCSEITTNSSWIFTCIVSLVEIYLTLGLTSFFFNLAKTCNGDLHSLKVDPKAYFRFLGFNIILGLVIIPFMLIAMLILSINILNIGFYPSMYEYELQYMVGSMIGGVIVIILLLLVVAVLFELFFFCTSYLILEGNSVKDSLKGSVKLMKGYKGKLFLTQLSFIGWGLLVLVTFGIYAIWFVPYYKSTMAQFYIELRRERENLKTKSEMSLYRNVKTEKQKANNYEKSDEVKNTLFIEESEMDSDYNSCEDDCEIDDSCDCGECDSSSDD